MKIKIVVALILVGARAALFAGPLALWYEQPMEPGHFMDEALPIGNGQSGALVSGGVANEKIILNEDSLWSGDANTSGDYGTMGKIGRAHV